jgi:hypothetical protein
MPRPLQAVIAALFLTLLTAAPAAADPLSRVTVDRRAGQRFGQLRDTGDGRAFVPRGVNYVRLAQVPGGSTYHSTFEPGLYDAARAEGALTALQRDGYNTVRVFIDMGSIPDAQLGRPHGVGRGVSDFGTVYGPYMDNVADFIRRADAHCIRVIPIVNAFPANSHYYTRVADRGPSPDIDGPNLWVLDSMHVQAREAYVRDFARALRDRLGPERLSAVLAYAIDNEAYVYGNLKPFAAGGPRYVRMANGRTYDMRSGGVGGDRQRAVDDAFTHVANRLTAAIRSVDPGALVTMGAFTHAAVGKQGPDGLARNCVGSGCPAVDYRYPVRPALLARDSALSFLDVHLYPMNQPGVNAPYTVSRDLATSEWSAIRGKPVVLGEYGAFKPFWNNDPIAAAFGMRNLQVETCRLGMGGWLYWTMDTLEPLGSQELFFMAVERQGAINGQLAPIARPDPCNPAVVHPYGPAGTCNRVARAAQPPAAAPGPAAPPDRSTTPSQPQQQRTVSAERGGVRLTVWRASLSQALRRGLRIRVRVPARGRVAASVRMDGRAVAVRRLQPRRAGAKRIRLYVARTARRELRDDRAVHVRVQVRFQPAQGEATVVRLRLVLRR